VGTTGVEKRIDVIATAMHGKLTVFDLEDLELSYAPPFGSSRDPVNNIGFAAANMLRGDCPVRHWDEVAALDSSEWFRWTSERRKSRLWEGWKALITSRWAN
jgi:hypothetical protein